jgi:hypothetical protein
VAHVVRLMLFKNYEKPDVPVKRQELNDVIQAGGTAHKQQPGPAHRVHWAIAHSDLRLGSTCSSVATSVTCLIRSDCILLRLAVCIDATATGYGALGCIPALLKCDYVLHYCSARCGTQKDVTHRVGRGGNKLPGVVLPLAAAKLATTFGLELREIKRQAGGAPARGAAAAANAGGRHVTCMHCQRMRMVQRCGSMQLFESKEGQGKLQSADCACHLCS